MAAMTLAFALPASADLRIVPSLTVSERYDSNVLFTSSGRGVQDFVTTVAPALRATYRGRPVTGTLSGGVGFSSFAKNSNFNFISTFGTASVDLTQLVGRLDKRASLRISESIQYTPELPAFVSETLGINPFESGIQAQRARSLTSITSVAGGYTLTSRVNVPASYTYSYLDFGNTIGAAPQAALFKTISHSLIAGPDITLTTTDTLNLKFLYTNVDFGGAPGFQTQGGTVGLTRRFSPQLTGKAAAGLNLITPSDRVTPVFNLSASWKGDRNTTATISFSRSVTPSFLIAASALTSNVVTVSATQGLTDSLLGSVSVNYVHSTSVRGTSVGAAGSSLTFDSFSASMGLSYSITRSLRTSFSYSHTYFEQESLNISSNFHRDIVTLSLTASWM